jgi:hypothetical protein
MLRAAAPQVGVRSGDRLRRQARATGSGGRLGRQARAAGSGGRLGRQDGSRRLDQRDGTREEEQLRQSWRRSPATQPGMGASRRDSSSAGRSVTACYSRIASLAAIASSAALHHWLHCIIRPRCIIALMRPLRPGGRSSPCRLGGAKAGIAVRSETPPAPRRIASRASRAARRASRAAPGIAGSVGHRGQRVGQRGQRAGHRGQRRASRAARRASRAARRASRAARRHRTHHPRRDGAPANRQGSVPPHWQPARKCANIAAPRLLMLSRWRCLAPPGSGSSAELNE